MDHWIDLTQGGEAAEILLSRPPRWVRSSIYLFCALFATVIAWAYLSKIDLYISAPGVVRPLGDLVTVQASVPGRLLRVTVKEAELVEKGQLLFQLESSEINSQLLKARKRHEGARGRFEVLRSSHETLLLQQKAELESDVIEISLAAGELKRAVTARERAASAVTEAQARMDEAQGAYQRTKRLVEQRIGTQADLQAKLQALKAAQAARSGSSAAARIAAQDVGLAGKKLELKKKQSEVAIRVNKGALAQLQSRRVGLDREVAETQLEIQRLENSLRQYAVRAPVRGVVTSLMHKTGGGFVKSGDVLLRIAPEGAAWIVEAQVPNRDAGPLREKIGGPVTLKFDAFPFRDYGTIQGSLVSVSPDATSHPKHGLVYTVQIRLATTTLRRGRRSGRIALGMTATAQIIKEKERILAILFREIRDRVSVD